MGLELLGDLPFVAGGGPGADGGVDFIFGGAAALEGGEVLALAEVGPLDDAAEGLPLVVVASGDGDPAVVTGRGLSGGGVDAVGDVLRGVIAVAGRGDAVGELFDEFGVEEVHGRFVLGDLEELALAGLLTLEEGGDEAGGGDGARVKSVWRVPMPTGGRSGAPM